MYKTNAAKWPVLASGTLLSCPFKLKHSGSIVRTLSRGAGCPHKRIPQVVSPASMSTTPRQLARFCSGSTTTPLPARCSQHRDVPSSAYRFRLLGHNSLLLSSIPHTPASFPSIPHRSLASGTRHLRTQIVKGSTKREATSTRQGQERTTKASLKSSKPSSPKPATTIPPNNQPPKKQEARPSETTTITTSDPAPRTERSTALDNLRVLLHPGVRILGHRLPSSITPPLPVLVHLFWHLNSSRCLEIGRAHV